MKIRHWISSLLICASSPSFGIEIFLPDIPTKKNVIAEIYTDANNFGDLRMPSQRITVDNYIPSSAINVTTPQQPYAIMVFIDENKNGILDRNFLGIPKEPVGFSNNYSPKGPPNYSKALVSDRTEKHNISFSYAFKGALSDSGLWGFGAGAIVQSNPYIGNGDLQSTIIPAITYTGEHIQWVGPEFRAGLIGSDKHRLSLAIAYRMAAYEEEDLELADDIDAPDDTLMVGLDYIINLPKGIDLEAGFKADTLGTSDGYIVSLNLGKGFQFGPASIEPSIGVDYLDSKLSQYEFGVSRNGTTIYATDAAYNINIGLSIFIDITDDIRLIANSQYAWLDSTLHGSPIVADDTVTSGFIAVTYVY